MWCVYCSGSVLQVVGALLEQPKATSIVHMAAILDTIQHEGKM